MGSFNPESYTKPQLLEALAKAGVAGMSRATKAELAQACAKLRGKARAAALEALAPVSLVSTKLAKPNPPVKKVTAAKAAVKKAKPSKKAIAAKPAIKENKPEIVTTQLEEIERPSEVYAPQQFAAAQMPPPPPGDFPLPESYGIDMFHVLVFDPYGAYIFWELSPELLGHLYEVFGEERWHSRKLIVRAEAASGKRISQELYGERGSYFMNVREPGTAVSFALGFLIGDHFESIAPKRTITFPRDRASEDLTVRLLEVTQAKEAIVLRELPAGEAEEVIRESLGGEFRTEGIEARLPNSADNVKAGGAK
jgi:hypothetical protein